MAMLRESSTSTATTFCCGRRVAMQMAGCQSRKSSSAIMAVSSSQITSGRTPVSRPRLRRTCQSSSTPAAMTPSGQHPDRPGRQQHKLPLLKNRAGILEQKLEHDALGSVRLSASSRK